MDRAKKPNTLISSRNCKIYLDLKDIIRENALRFLPAKSLCRSTAVCRDWMIHISTPFFSHNQSNSFRDVSGFFCQSHGSLPSFVSLDPRAYGVPDPSLRFLPEPVDIKCSSNGLLCCQGRSGNKAYYICNPLTRKWKTLPKPDANHGSDPALVLVYEPSLMNFVAEYKLICAFPSDLDGYEFDIYSSVDGSWRTSREIFFGNRQIIPSSGVYVHGVVYWRSRHTIIAFDLATERSTLHYSDSQSDYLGTSSGPLGEVNGKLCSASMKGSKLILSELSNAYTNTMQMHSSTKAWQTKQITLNHSVFDGSAVDRSVKFTGEVMLIKSGGTFLSYNMNTKHIKQLDTETNCHGRILPYVNSLVEI